MFVAWRDLAHARGRFVLMIAVVVLITTLVGLLSGLTQGLGRESTSAITGLETSRLVFSGSDPSFASSRIPVSAGITGEPIGITTLRATSGRETLPITAMGVPANNSVAPDAAGVGPGSVVVSEPLAQSLMVAAGDHIKIGSEEFTVASARGEASFAHTPVVWMDLRDWHHVSGAGDAATVVAASSSVEVPKGYRSVPLGDAVKAIGSYTAENNSLQLIRGFLFAISALVIGAFFTVWTIQRTRDIAVLKALGATTAYVLRDALGQAVVVLLTGTLAGAFITVLAGSFAEGRVPFMLSITTIGLPLVVLNLLGMAGAALAVRRVTSVDPLIALGTA